MEQNRKHLPETTSAWRSHLETTSA